MGYTVTCIRQQSEPQSWVYAITCIGQQPRQQSWVHAITCTRQQSRLQSWGHAVTCIGQQAEGPGYQQADKQAVAQGSGIGVVALNICFPSRHRALETEALLCHQTCTKSRDSHTILHYNHVVLLYLVSKTLPPPAPCCVLGR